MHFEESYQTKSLFLSVNVFENVLKIGGSCLTFLLPDLLDELESELSCTDAEAVPACGCVCVWL